MYLLSSLVPGFGRQPSQQEVEVLTPQNQQAQRVETAAERGKGWFSPQAWCDAGINAAIPRVLTDKAEKVQEDLQELEAMFESKAIFDVLNHLIEKQLPNLLTQNGISQSNHPRVIGNVQHIALKGIKELVKQHYDEKSDKLALSDLLKVIGATASKHQLASIETNGIDAILGSSMHQNLNHLLLGAVIPEVLNRVGDALSIEIQQAFYEEFEKTLNTYKREGENTLDTFAEDLPKYLEASGEKSLANAIREQFGNDHPLRYLQLIDIIVPDILDKHDLPKSEQESIIAAMRLRALRALVHAQKQTGKNTLKELAEHIQPNRGTAMILSERLFTLALGKNYANVKLAAAEEKAGWFNPLWQGIDNQVIAAIGLDQIRDQLIPELLMSVLNDPKAVRENQQALKELFPSGSGDAVTSTLAKLVSYDVIPALFVETKVNKDLNALDIAKLIFEALEYPLPEDPAQRQILIEELGGQLIGIREDRTLGSKQVNEAIQGVIKGYFDRIGVNLGRLAARIDDKDGVRFKHTVRDMAKMTKDHLAALKKSCPQSIGRVTNIWNKIKWHILGTGYKEDEVNYFRDGDYARAKGVFLEEGLLVRKDKPLNPDGFRNYVIPLDESALTEGEKKAHRLDQFYKPYAKRLLKVLVPEGAKALQLPKEVDQQQRDNIWQQLEENVLPNVLMSVLGQLNDPKQKDKLFISIVENLTKPQFGPQPAFLQPQVADVDRMSAQDRAVWQGEMNQVAGELANIFTSLLPGSVGHVLFKLSFGKLEESVGQIAGEAISNQLDQKSLMLILEQSFTALNANLNPDGTYKNNFAVTEEEAQISADSKIADRLQTQENVKVAQHDLFNYIVANVQSTLKAQFWDSLHDSIDARLNETSPDLLAAKQVLDKVFNFICFKVVGSILAIAFAPVWFPAYLGFKLYMTDKIKQSEELFHHPMNEVLMMRYAERILDMLEEEQIA